MCSLYLERTGKVSTSEHINEYFNGKGFMALSAVALVVVTLMALTLGIQPPEVKGQGLFYTLQGTLVDAGPVSAGINLLCLLATGAIVLALNKVYTFVRSMTHMFVSAFFLLQLANPSVLVAFNAGTLLCLVAAVTLMPLFASFQDGHAQRSIFLIFALVATGTMFHYGFILLIPAYLLGFANMRALGLKGVLAMLFGLVTPFWIAFGLGIVSPSDAQLPQWALLQRPQMSLQLALAVSIAVLGLVLMVSNLFTIMNYRMQPRVYNIFLMIMPVMVIIAACLDYHDLAVFFPLLSLMVAVQIAQAYTLWTTFHHRYVFMLLFIVVCLTSAAAFLLP